MKKDYKVWDKVVPHAKTIADSLEDSLEWKRAREKGQEFLYVARNDVSGYLSLRNDNQGITGDWFNYSDVTPYEEPNKPQTYSVNQFIHKFSKVSYED